MLSKSVGSIPPGASYEPKWDGFRSICFRDGDEVELGSRDERPLTRYFPDWWPRPLAELPYRCVIDGEVIIITDDRLDFEALQQRIHPADSRVECSPPRPRLPSSPSTCSPSATTTAHTPVHRAPGGPRSMRWPTPAPVIHVTPSTTDLAVAQRWFEVFEGAGLDGIIAKPLTGTYQPDTRACRRSSTSGPPTALSPVTACTSPVPRGGLPPPRAL